MRRIAVLTAACLAVLVAGGCRHDGRTLRPAKPNQVSSISTIDPAASDVPSFIDPSDIFDDATDGLPDELTVTAPWRDGAAIDARYTCAGANVWRAALSWSPPPEGTEEIAITLSDLDAPSFTHWAIAGISPQTIAIDEDTVPVGAYESLNGNGTIGYQGPCPPAGSVHTYLIAVHYLGTAVGLSDGVSGQEMTDAIAASEIATAEVTGTFSRA